MDEFTNSTIAFLGVLVLIVIAIIIFFIQQEIEKTKFKKGWFKAGIILIIIAVLNPFFIMLVSSTKFSVVEINALGTVGDFFGGRTVGLLSLASIFFCNSYYWNSKKRT